MAKITKACNKNIFGDSYKQRNHTLKNSLLLLYLIYRKFIFHMTKFKKCCIRDKTEFTILQNKLILHTLLLSSFLLSSNLLSSFLFFSPYLSSSLFLFASLLSFPLYSSLPFSSLPFSFSLLSSLLSFLLYSTLF